MCRNNGGSGLFSIDNDAVLMLYFRK